MFDMFYIMKAHHINNGHANLADIKECENDCTILQVEDCYGKAKKNIIGSGRDYAKVGDEIDFTFDTGMGHRPGGVAVVKGVMHISRDDEVEGELPIKTKLATYVMK